VILCGWVFVGVDLCELFKRKFWVYLKEKIAEAMTQFLSCDGLELENLDLLLETLKATSKNFIPAKAGIQKPLI
jgi:hypothetical protein